MPAVVSHYLMSMRLIDDIAEFYPNLHLNKTAFIWGGNGPDFFFCHRIMPWQRGKSYTKVGTKLHKLEPEKSLNYLLAHAKILESDTATSYVLGFLSHYAFDSVAHPYILYQADKMAKNGKNMHPSICHNDIEAHLDSILLMRETGKKPRSVKLQDLSPLDSDVMRTVAEMIHGLLVMYNIEAPTKNEIITAQYDWHTGLKHLSDRTYCKRPILSVAEKAVKLPPVLSSLVRTAPEKAEHDYANISHNGWISPFEPNTVRNDSFFDLYETAHKKSLKLISCAMNGSDLTDIVKGVPFG